MVICNDYLLSLDSSYSFGVFTALPKQLVMLYCSLSLINTNFVFVKLYFSCSLINTYFLLFMTHVDVTDYVVASKRLIASESMSELHFAKRARGGVAWDVDSPHVTPPGTPPPPYPAPTSEDQADNNSSRGEVSVESY